VRRSDHEDDAGHEHQDGDGGEDDAEEVLVGHEYRLARIDKDPSVWPRRERNP
jgi:hypothetical protein